MSVPGEGSVRRVDPLFKMTVVNGTRAVVETNIRKGIDLDARDERGSEQYHQISNAVPPKLVQQIAEIVTDVLDAIRRRR